MLSSTEFPKADEALVRAINRAVDDNATYRNRTTTKMEIAEAWLAGARRFNGVSFEEGTLDGIDFQDEGEDNPLAFALNLTLQKCVTEYARLTGQDLSPSVTQLQNNLTGLRKASAAQIVLDAMFSQDKMAVAWGATRRGAIFGGPVGLRPVLSERPDGSLVVEPDIIRGDQLGSVPANKPIGECDAVTRVRSVTVAWLKAQPSLKVPRGEDGLQKMKAKKVPYGRRADSVGADVGYYGGAAGEDDSSWHVELRELWEKGPEDTYRRYVAVAGDALLVDTHYDEKWMAENNAPSAPPFPIWMATYSQHLDFYGRGKAEQLIPLERITEETFAALNRIAKEYDQYGILLMPGGMGAAVEDMLKDIGNRGPKLGTYEFQPGSERGGIVSVTPANAGSMPGQVGQMFHGLLNEQAGQSPLLQGIGPSRVGQPGLETLFQASNIPLDAPASMQAEMWTRFYKTALYEIKLRFRPGDAIRLAVIDDNICGISVDPNTLEVGLDSSGLPWPHEVNIGVRTANISDKQGELEKAIMLRNAQMISDLEFWTWNFRKRLGIDGPKRRIQNAVEQAQLQHMILFNDGVTPGKGGGINIHEEDALEVYEMLLTEFRSKPEYKWAGPDVKLAFEQYKGEIARLRGQALPRGMPSAEEAAAIDEMLRRQQGGQGGPPGRPGPQ